MIANTIVADVMRALAIPLVDEPLMPVEFDTTIMIMLVIIRAGVA